MTFRCMLLLAVAFLAVVFAGLIFHSDLVGWWRGEAQYQGRYTNSWRDELREYECLGRFPWMCGPAATWDLIYERKPPAWEQWLALTVLGAYKSKTDSRPPLQDGDEEASAVLLELLHTPEWNVRLLAIDGLRAIGGNADVAVPALRSMLEDENVLVVKTAKWALWDIARLPWGDTLSADDDTDHGKPR